MRYLLQRLIIAVVRSALSTVQIIIGQLYVSPVEQAHITLLYDYLLCTLIHLSGEIVRLKPVRDNAPYLPLCLLPRLIIVLRYLLWCKLCFGLIQQVIEPILTNQAYVLTA